MKIELDPADVAAIAKLAIRPTARFPDGHFEQVAAECSTIACFRHPRKLDNYVANLPASVKHDDLFSAAYDQTRQLISELYELRKSLGHESCRQEPETP